MSKLFNWAAARIVVAFALALPLVAMADVQMTNPVTGETETYENTFVGGSGKWNSAENWTLKESDKVPFVSGGNFAPALVTGKVVTATAAIDGWTLRVGAYNGATVYWNGGITKIQASTVGCWLTADEESVIEIKSFAGNQLEGSDSLPLKLSSAKDGGITWVGGITNATNATLPFWHYLKGSGTVVYCGDITVANAQVIKMADVALSGNAKSVQSKTLVTFGSGTTKTFTADAEIKIKDGDEVIKTVYLASVTAGATTLTTAADVGTCELVQTSTSIDLYYVDGDPADVPAPTVYKPSININFTNGSGLTTRADVGLDGYAVPGTSWNNFTIPNDANEQTFNTVNSIDSTGAASVAAGVSVKVSGHRGSYSCGNLTAASNPLHGYIDEGAQKATPTVTITGIPYEHYRVIVYHSTDTANVPFGYDTINGFNFTYVNGVQTTGTDSWGASGADQSAEPIAEGTNTLVSAVLSGDTVTMVAHRIGGATPSARGCFAAIQVVEYVPEVGENDLEIAVEGATEYAVNEEKNLSGTVYLTGSGTLTLSGDYKITAATIDVAKDVVLNINADRLDATTFTGSGTVVYDTTAPVEGKGWANIGWSGTVWIKNQSVSSFEGTKFGNAGSTVRFTGVTGYLQTSSYNSSTYVHTVPLELVDEGDTIAFTYNNGWGGNLVKINTLKGTGTLKTQGSGAGEHIYIVDASGFTGVFNLTCKYVYVGGSQPADYSASTNPNGKLELRSGVTMTVPAEKTWTANGGFVVNGTLNVDGTLASSHATKAVSGAGTVVFTGRAPTVAGDAWWKNADWTGTVEIKGVTALNGDYVFNDYGNSNSTLKLTNCTGWLKPNYTCVPALEIGGTFTWNDGSSKLENTFKVATLKGSGTISIPDQGAATAVWQITDDWSGFTGAVVGNNSAAKRVLVFGSTLPTTIAAGDIYISEGATLNLDNASSAWWGVGMRFVVDGTVKATNRSKWGGGTAMTIGDTGVLEITRSDSASADDGGTDYSNVTGTGTIKFSGSGFTVISQSIPTSLTFAAEKDSGSVVPVAGATIGSLTGSKGIRSDWGNNGSGGRYLTIKQSKDTSWDGLINVDGVHRLTGVIVDPLDSATGTLTLTATQTASSTLSVNGAVNLTGTWVGATTVAGTFGGTGTLTGDLTFSDGATLKANASALTVSGTVTLPTGDGESLTIDATGLDADEVTILSSESITAETDVSKVNVDGLYTVTPVAGAIKLVSTRVEITVPAINNATVTVSVGGETIGTEAGTYKVAPDAVVTATYAAAEGYEISGQTVYTIDVANSETTFDPAGTTEVKQYVAYVVFQQESGQSFIDVTNNYTTVSNAIDAAKAMKKTVVLIAQPEATDTYAIAAGETINVKKGEFTFDGIIFPEGAQYNNTTTVTAGVTQYKCTTYTATVQYPGEDPQGVTTPLAMILNGLYTGYAPSLAGTIVTVLDGSDATLGDVMPEVFTYNSEAHTYTLKTMVASYNNGYTTTYYPTVSNAVATVASGSTITLVENVALDESVEVAAGKNVTIDLNGKTVTGPAGGYVFANAGEVTITGNGTVTGAGGIAENTASDASVSIASGSYTATGDLFANVEGATIAVSGGTFNQSVADEYLAEGYEVTDNGDGTYGVREDKGWVYSAPGHWDYTGTWSEGATLGADKVAISDGGATYSNRTASAGQLVTLDMTLSFDDANDSEEGYEDAKAAIRLGTGETEGTYVFQLYTSENSTPTWKSATGFSPVTNTDYNIVFVLDLTNKTYTASLVSGTTTNALSVAGSTTMAFANQNNATPVQQIEFVGAGTVSSIEGSYEDAPAPEEFVENQVIGNVTLTDDQADWLNAQNNYAALAAKIATMTAAAFNDAYPLNLDILSEQYDGSYEFVVTGIAVGPAEVDVGAPQPVQVPNAVTVTVKLERKGALGGGINGILRLKGGNSLPASTFVVIGGDGVVIDDDRFKNGDEATIIFEKDSQNDAAFYQPVIESVYK